MRDVLNDLYKRCVSSLELHHPAKAAGSGLETLKLTGEQSPAIGDFLCSYCGRASCICTYGELCTGSLYGWPSPVKRLFPNLCTAPAPRLETEDGGYRNLTGGKLMPKCIYWPSASGNHHKEAASWQLI